MMSGKKKQSKNSVDTFYIFQDKYNFKVLLYWQLSIVSDKHKMVAGCDVRMTRSQI